MKSEELLWMQMHITADYQQELAVRLPSIFSHSKTVPPEQEEKMHV